MSKRIQTYADLIEEKERLENLLNSKKLEIKEDWTGVKQQLTPVTNLFSFFGKMTRRNKANPLLNFGIDMAGDVFIKKFLLRRADWVTRLLLPMFIKNYSSNVLGEPRGGGLFKKIRHILSKKRGTPDTAYNTAPVVPSTGPINPSAAPVSGATTTPV